MSQDFFVPLADDEVPERFLWIPSIYRARSSKVGVLGSAPICYRVHAGFTLKQHAPLFGPCYKNFSYLQDWSFKDEPTRDSIVFWVPRLLEGSYNKSTRNQFALLSELRTRLELPDHHMNGFGQIGLVAGLILAHFKATGERFSLIVRSDSCVADGSRLRLSWDEGALDCDYWRGGDGPGEDVCVFALGVEALGT